MLLLLFYQQCMQWDAACSIHKLHDIWEIQYAIEYVLPVLWEVLGRDS